MEQKTLNEILEKHKKWLNNDKDGVRADLSYAHLRGADLRYADLNGTYMDESTKKAIIRLTNRVPKTGSFIGYKKCSDNIIVELEITEDALRSNATTNKCRCSKAKVLKMYDLNHNELPDDTIAYSRYPFAPTLEYKVGKILEIKDFNTNRFNECSTGIHFFLTFDEAVAYCSF